MSIIYQISIHSVVLSLSPALFIFSHLIISNVNICHSYNMYKIALSMCTFIIVRTNKALQALVIFCSFVFVVKNIVIACAFG